MNLNTLKDKVVTFVKEHKKELIIAGVATTVIVVGVILKNKKAAKEIAVLALPPLPKVPKVDRVDLAKIDEDLFTRFAPELEAMILNEHIDEGVIRATYKIHYPNSNGTNEVIRDVVCTVTEKCNIVNF